MTQEIDIGKRCSREKSWFTSSSICVYSLRPYDTL